jgi:Ras GTPase-activating-like protein IQGAP2/3
LRFINPAIVTPQSYMIVDQPPEKNARRTLTLIAKMLQNLANKPTYSKEMYMMVLNSFVDDNKDRISQFLNDLCKVEDFYEGLELDQYLALSKKDLSINISLNEIYSTHTLLLQHQDVICSGAHNASPMKSPISAVPAYSDHSTPSPISPSRAQSLASNRVSMTPEQSYMISCHHLRLLLNDLGSNAPAQLSRSENKSIALSLFSRWETAPILFPEMAAALSSKETTVTRGNVAQYRMDDEPLSDGDVLYMDTKALIIQILRKQALAAADALSSLYENHVYVPPISINNVPEHFEGCVIKIEEILEKACCESSDEVTAKRGLRTLQNLRILEDRYHHPMVHRVDGYDALARDIHSEFQNLSLLLHKLKQEQESLNTVYRTICTHNQYLRMQLESYKAYLQNARIQAARGKRSDASVMVGVTPIVPPKASSTSFKSKVSSKYKQDTAQGTFKFTHVQLEKDGVIVESAVPDNRRSNIYFSVSSPIPGSFLISLHYKGRDKPILEVEMQLDDLLEKQQDNVQLLDLEYVQLNVNKVLHLLNKTFLKR